ncbi:MAG: hypothetical protein OEM59_17180 [Rhodospirillales bacterium]|nr:hypothetical protein [Rhodospirillales bacterium]
MALPNAKQPVHLAALGDQPPIGARVGQEFAAPCLGVEDPDPAGATSRRILRSGHGSELEGNVLGQEIGLGQDTVTAAFQRIALETYVRLMIAQNHKGNLIPHSFLFKTSQGRIFPVSSPA